MIGAWGSQGDGPGQFDLPWGIAVDGQGAVYVADWANDRIQKFSSATGCTSRRSRHPPPGDGQLTRPSGVDVDGDGNVYVADWGEQSRPGLQPGHGGHLTTLLGDSGLSGWARGRDAE